MQERGRMQVGMVADITIFNPLKAKAEATFKQGEQGRPSSGIPYVIVNGQMVVRNSKFQKVWAGQPIRFPVEAKGRMEPLTAEQWIKSFSINVPPLDDAATGPQSAGAKGAQRK
jgi:formylmethanofuran dehydrogenase subunit A